MSDSSSYNAQAIEKKWYSYWKKNALFQSQPHPSKTPYTILMPPPNITGTLHMGHILNNTIQDVLVRKARMQGQEVCWIPGIDHASIATEAKVVAMLQEKKIQKKELTRAQFIQHAWEWKEKYGHIIFTQLEKLGISCDWSRTQFTMNPAHSAAVIKAFIQLYEQGYIYRGKRMIHWDPQGKTALSNDEVIYKLTPSKLYYIRYAIENSKEYITIATTRPETVLGDTALCIHPKDKRYQHLTMRRVQVPLINRSIPIIQDTYVDTQFGTGCLKVTPAHDIHDYTIGLQYNLPIIDILNDDGTLNEQAQLYIGEDRFVARKKIIQQLKATGHLVKVEAHQSNIGYSERTQAIVEPKVSQQWFVKTSSLAQPALESVRSEKIVFHPARFKNLYYSWMENIQDWCISRQLWWGHQIPAYYLSDGTVLVAKDRDSALSKARSLKKDPTLTSHDIYQDEDVLDTWFSAWLLPMTAFGGLQDYPSKELDYYYPTNDLVTAPEIIFFWVARMIMAGYAFRGKPPFRNVYFTGIVRDHNKAKMSKSLGNSPNPIQLIEQYSADGVRTGMLFSAPAGNDLLFNEQYCKQGRNFAHKLWNAFQLIQGWTVSTLPSTTADQVAIRWFDAHLNNILRIVDTQFVQYRIASVLMTLYKLLWDDFCPWYLEMIKPPYGKPIAHNTYQATCIFLEKIIKVLHPFMPFMTEEIWSQLQPCTQSTCLMIASWPQIGEIDNLLLDQAKKTFELITQTRKLRTQYHIPSKYVLSVYIQPPYPAFLQRFMEHIAKLAYIKIIEYNMDVDSIDLDNIQPLTLGHQTYYFMIDKKLDQQQSIQQLKEELVYTQQFLELIRKKTKNQQFMQRAPSKVIAMEQKKEIDAIEKIQALTISLQKFSS